MTTTDKLGGFATAEDLEKARARAVVTRIDSHGELVYEPGMSEEEQAVRSADSLWRHGGAEAARQAAALAVEEGRWTQEQADEHIRRQEERARGLRALVVRCDEARAKRLSDSDVKAGE